MWDWKDSQVYKERKGNGVYPEVCVRCPLCICDFGDHICHRIIWGHGKLPASGIVSSCTEYSPAGKIPFSVECRNIYHCVVFMPDTCTCGYCCLMSVRVCFVRTGRADISVLSVTRAVGAIIRGFRVYDFGGGSYFEDVCDHRISFGGSGYRRRMLLERLGAGETEGVKEPLYS